MPVISMFYGVIVLMYYFDNRKPTNRIFMSDTAMRRPSYQYQKAISSKARSDALNSN
jgi:hypothetical protein